MTSSTDRQEMDREWLHGLRRVSLVMILVALGAILLNGFDDFDDTLAGIIFVGALIGWGLYAALSTVVWLARRWRRQP